MKFYPIGLFLLIIVTMNGVVRSQDTSSFSSDLESIIRSISTIEKKWILEKDIKAECELIVSRTGALQELYRLNGSNGISALYRNTLLPYITILNQYELKSAGKADARLIAAIRELSDELRIKLLYARSLKGGFFSGIEVVIETKISGSPISGYEVWFVPKGWMGNDERYERFDNLSTPAVKNLPPGNYFIWTKKGKYKSSSYPFSFGFDGQTKRRIELEVNEN